jgi:hypothetical protein
LGQRDEVTGEWTKLHNEFNNLYSTLNIIWVIKSRKMRRAGHIPRMGERRAVYRVLVWKPEKRDYLENPGTDGSVILRWIFKMYDGKHGLD